MKRCLIKKIHVDEMTRHTKVHLSKVSVSGTE